MKHKFHLLPKLFQKKKKNKKHAADYYVKFKNISNSKQTSSSTTLPNLEYPRWRISTHRRTGNKREDNIMIESTNEEITWM